MSRAEISAYLHGADHASRLLELELPTTIMGRMDEVVVNPEEVAAFERLGGEAYAYWVLRGVRDVLAERPTR